MSVKRNDNKPKAADAFDAHPDVALIDPVDLDDYGTNDAGRPGSARDSHHAAAQNRKPSHRGDVRGTYGQGNLGKA
jgi:hypothetical protein